MRIITFVPEARKNVSTCKALGGRGQGGKQLGGQEGAKSLWKKKSKRHSQNSRVEKEKGGRHEYTQTWHGELENTSPSRNIQKKGGKGNVTIKRHELFVGTSEE